MKRSLKLLTAASAVAIAVAGQASAADMLIPEVVEAPVYHAPAVETSSASGWYLRGDLGYAMNRMSDVTYITQGAGVNGSSTLFGELSDSYSVGVGVGAHITDYLRADVTLDYMTKADFEGFTNGTCTGNGADGLPGTADDVVDEYCRSSDTSSFKALTVMANAYVDLGTYGSITPYVGAGIGGAHVTWGELANTIPAGFVQSGTTTHAGGKDWRFAWALHAGASIDVTCNTAVDVGYSYQHITGGQMFDYAEAGGVGAGGPGFDDGIKSHTVRAGLRYKFGAGSNCGQKVVHHPQPMPPVYK